MAEITDAQLRACIATVFSVEPSAITDALRPGDIPPWDSLGHLALVSALEQQFGMTLSMEEALAINSIADVRTILATHDIRIVSGG